ncbi:hypothetical protein EET67_00700 [Pseudaminobacter arsenicus]|uniref:DUF3035 domain-containing protein n=1 Tax=Borborobacter arsenicus TaxID=1851146 RepID=A0A432VBG6_9HYPH|nr:hypothetical protein [Pseudaminobacter arsenicus]RUM99466.1 hypothetical protein EET67_00700 [Pseudaminobacter arsenicus]
MTERIGAGIFSRLRLAAGLGLAAAAFIQLPACSTVPEVASAPPSGLSSGQPTDTGTFPNLNIPPQTAAAQITPEEKAEKFSELEAAKATQSAPPGGGATADQSRLKKIAATHAAETLAKIEGQ